MAWIGNNGGKTTERKSDLAREAGTLVTSLGAASHRLEKMQTAHDRQLAGREVVMEPQNWEPQLVWGKIALLPKRNKMTRRHRNNDRRWARSDWELPRNKWTDSRRNIIGRSSNGGLARQNSWRKHNARNSKWLTIERHRRVNRRSPLWPNKYQSTLADRFVRRAILPALKLPAGCRCRLPRWREFTLRRPILYQCHPDHKTMARRNHNFRIILPKGQHQRYFRRLS